MYNHTTQIVGHYQEGVEDRLPRQQLHGYISTEARDGWYDFAESHGTNVTALLEATGVLLGKHAKRESRRLPTWLRELLAEAQRVASVRSSRRRQG